MDAPGRAVSLVILGAWIGMLVASWVVAAVNFRTADRVLGESARPETSVKLAPVPAEDRRMVLRHLASEINRWIFRRWAPAQILLGCVVLAARRAGGGCRALVGIALALTVVQAAGLTPRIAELGRALDFVPRPLPAITARRFGLLHASYVVADLAKAVLLSAAAWILARRPLP